MPKKNKKKIAYSDTPEGRGCLSCNRWKSFVKLVWEADQEICPEASCFKINNAKAPEVEAKTPEPGAEPEH